MLAQESWQPFASPEGRFQILMPGTPQLIEGGFRAVTGGGTYTVTYADLGAEELAEGPEAVYQKARQRLIGARKVEERGFREVPSHGLVCKELRYVSAPRAGHPGDSGLARWCLAGGRLYLVEAVVPRGMSSSEVLSFVGSFRVLMPETTPTPEQ